jgi:DNA polymerase IV (DinB-like DNA polymerase)
VKDFDEAKEFAKSLMSEVLEKESLTCSIGVAPNEMVAKIASDFKKPYGPTVVKEEDVKGSCSRRKSERSPVLDPRLNGC